MLARDPQADVAFEASKPIAEQEYNCVEFLRTFDPSAAKTWPSTDRPTRADVYFWHLETLLEIVATQLPAIEVDIVYRCWMAFSAGFRGCRALTANVAKLDYWYQAGRAARQRQASR